jgi:hypothetical protein
MSTKDRCDAEVGAPGEDVGGSVEEQIIVDDVGTGQPYLPIRD